MTFCRHIQTIMLDQDGNPICRDCGEQEEVSKDPFDVSPYTPRIIDEPASPITYYSAAEWD